MATRSFHSTILHHRGAFLYYTRLFLLPQQQQVFLTCNFWLMEGLGGPDFEPNFDVSAHQNLLPQSKTQSKSCACSTASSIWICEKVKDCERSYQHPICWHLGERYERRRPFRDRWLGEGVQEKHTAWVIQRRLSARANSTQSLDSKRPDDSQLENFHFR